MGCTGLENCFEKLAQSLNSSGLSLVRAALCSADEGNNLARNTASLAPMIFESEPASRSGRLLFPISDGFAW